jgi:hypothetical protein
LAAFPLVAETVARSQQVFSATAIENSARSSENFSKRKIVLHAFLVDRGIYWQEGTLWILRTWHDLAFIQVQKAAGRSLAVSGDGIH